jgi:uncharacterized protein
LVVSHPCDSKKSQGWGTDKVHNQTVRALGPGIAYPKDVSLDWSNTELAAGLSCYRREEFFDAHEHWESAWMQSRDAERSFLQGLIQLTVAFHHLTNGNFAGSVSLLRRALIRFERCPERFGGVDVAALRNEARAWLDAIESKAASLPATYPGIRLVE